ncbi:MAG TPA: glucose-6-phosphate isomerase [Clostridiales bacterium]|nr:glucose-6-phosphate isomerase [Clostridiales bacterium]
MLKLETKSIAPRREAMASYAQKVAKAHQKLHDGSLAMTGWVDLPANVNETYLAEILTVSAEIRRQYTALVVIGIGGSYLGTRACYDLLEASRCGVKLFFAGWNLGGRYHEKLLQKLDGHDVALCVISKSGTTLETTLAFNLLKNYMEGRYGRDFSDRVYVITGENSGALRQEAVEKGYRVFSLDEEIGGRYSVLTCVGLLPLAAAGIDVAALLDGAKAAYDDLNCADMEQNPCYQYAAYRNVLFAEGKVTEFFSFVEPEMFRFGFWLKQLFAESEGKNCRGIYPSALLYSTDLHSVGQFLEDGHPIFFETMITLASYATGSAAEGYQNIYHEHTMAMADAVYHVRNEKATPIMKLTMDALDAKNLGYMIYFFEKACAMSCLLMGVNPFDQPGVEAYKNQMRLLLD